MKNNTKGYDFRIGVTILMNLLYFESKLKEVGTYKCRLNKQNLWFHVGS